MMPYVVRHRAFSFSVANKGVRISRPFCLVLLQLSNKVCRMAEKINLEEAVEFADNPEPRCPCVLLLDTSGSMQGERIDALNEGLRTFRNQLVGNTLASRRTEVAIVTFNTEVVVAQEFVTADSFHPPVLIANGETHMGEGIHRALDLVKARVDRYRRNGIPCYRPWVFMITDGKPEGEDTKVMAVAGRRLRAAE